MQKLSPQVRRYLSRDGRWRSVLQALEQQGWRVQLLNGGHVRAAPPDKTREMVTFSATPGSGRALTAALADLRRSGFVYEH